MASQKLTSECVSDFKYFQYFYMFITYLTTLSVAQTVESQMVWWLMNSGLEKMLREVAVA